MDFVENIRVCEKSAKTGFGAKVDGPAAIFDAREISRVRVAEDPPAKGDETRAFLWFRQLGYHSLIFWSNLSDEDLIRIYA